MAFRLSSPTFPDEGPIPVDCTCDGRDEPPVLRWSGAPAGTQSFALIVDDPDAPGATFTHWLLYDIPGDATGLPSTPAGRSLHNDFGKKGYGGPCPPRGHGRHRYFFTLHAVDVPTLTLDDDSREDLEAALSEHSLGIARWMGHYEREK